MAYERKLRFKEGDRVIHCSNTGFTGGDMAQRVRHGIVTRIFYKTNKRGAKHPFVEVLMDNTGHREQYMASRVELEADKQQVLAKHVESSQVR